MPEKVIVPANVLASPAAQNVYSGKAGATITQGQLLYKDPIDLSLKLYVANGAAPTNVLEGIALNEAEPGQYVAYTQRDAALTPGYPIAAGDVIIGASSTPGASTDAADAAVGDFVVVLGVGIGNNQLNFNPTASGKAKP